MQQGTQGQNLRISAVRAVVVSAQNPKIGRQCHSFLTPFLSNEIGAAPLLAPALAG